MKKNIILISHNFSPDPIGIGRYNGEMIDWLLKNGYNCTVITTFPYYPYWKIQKPYKNFWYKTETIDYPDSNTTLKIYRCPSYIPSNPTGKKRAFQDFTFLISKFWVVCKMMLLNKKFDLIVTIAPPFHLAYLGLLLRSRTGGKLLYHVQDMQIEAARDLKMFYNKKILHQLFKMEYRILSEADYVSSISDGMINKMKEKIDRQIFYFPNWVDTDFFSPMPLRHLLKAKWNFKEDDFVCLYSGAVGVKQGLEGILDAAANLQHVSRIKFLICASGPYKDILVKEAGDKGLKNVKFIPLQVKDDFKELLNMADLHLVIQKANADDLVMPSKLATILSVGGVSIITSSEGIALYNMVNQFDFGYTVEPGKQQTVS